MTSVGEYWQVVEGEEIPMVAARTPNISRAPSEERAARVVSSAAASAPASRRKGARVSWQAKLRPDLQPEVVEDRRRGGTLLLPTPLLVGEIVAAIPTGQIMTMGQLRAQLAQRFHADRACPLMTGIFATILAGAVAEDLGQRRKPRWPIWRLVQDDGTLHPKWPLDSLYRAAMLREEGVRLTHHNGHWAAIDTQHC
jgi:alkylated DNA nucleotide flippase Atl1